MKTLRLIILMIITSLVLSVWTPTTVSAKAEGDQVADLISSFENANVAILTVDNRTGGSLSIQLQALPFDRKHQGPIPPKSYWFLATKQGKTQYQILPGRYTYTIRSSNCGGKRLDTKIFKGSIMLGPYYCDKK